MLNGIANMSTLHIVYSSYMSLKQVILCSLISFVIFHTIQYVFSFIFYFLINRIRKINEIQVIVPFMHIFKVKNCVLELKVSMANESYLKCNDTTQYFFIKSTQNNIK